jgi:hypothetical protein
MAIIGAAAIAGGAAIFGAASSSKASKAAAEAQKEAAALQTLVARELHDHWKAYYQQCDIKMISEVCATPPYVPQYDAVMGRTRAEVLREFGRARAQVNRSQSIYCVGQFAQQCNFIAGIEAVALSDATNFGYRREETQKIQLDQVRLENIYRWLGLGRNLLSQSNAASIAASAAATRLGAQAAAQGAGWAQLAGFLTSKEGQALGGRIGSALDKLFSGTPTQAQQDAAASNGQWDQPGSFTVGQTATTPPDGTGAASQQFNTGAIDSPTVSQPQSDGATGMSGVGFGEAGGQ